MKNNIIFAIRQLFFIPYDIASIYKFDPALKGKLLSFLEIPLYAGIWAIIFHRISHLLFALKIPFFPILISQISRFLTGIEIHPSAKINKGLFIDHGMSVVIGETTIIGKNVLIYHEVTLGGTSLKNEKRHPTIEDNVLIGAGAKVFGNITIGKNSQIGGGSVVVKNVPKNHIAVGNPARNISREKTNNKSNKEVNQIDIEEK